MSLLANIVGFSLFGLAARVGQLGIQKRPIFESASARNVPSAVDPPADCPVLPRLPLRPPVSTL